MREIKFRAKRLDNNEWVYGYYLYIKGQDKHYILTGKIKTYMVDDYLATSDFEWVEVDFETVGKFTGKKDKNGVEIYEGDILKTKFGRICKVVWFSSDSDNCFDICPINRFYDVNKAPDRYDLWKSDNIDVIGNIHDNPELLGAKE